MMPGWWGDFDKFPWSLPLGRALRIPVRLHSKRNRLCVLKLACGSSFASKSGGACRGRVRQLRDEWSYRMKDDAAALGLLHASECI
jgi:hypothetical protein